MLATSSQSGWVILFAGWYKQYPLPQILLFCILGIMSEAVSYRKLHSFIRIRFALLSRAFPDLKVRH